MLAARDRLRQLAVASLVMGYILIVVGVIVRVEGAGMGCGDDWPVCNGEVVPTFDYLTAIEYLHRVIAGFVLLLTVGLVWFARRAGDLPRLARVLPVVAVALVVAQALLGAVTVFTELEPGAVTAHLGMAQAYFASILVLALLLTRERFSSRPMAGSWSRAGHWLLVAAASVYLLLLSGAWTASSGAAWACPEWPACNGNYVPTGTSLVDVHLLHRWLALLALATVGIALVQVWRVRGDARVIVGLVTAAATLMVAQVFIGAANIWLELTSWVRATHLAVATLVWAALVAAIALDRLVARSSESPDDAMGIGRRRARDVAADYVTTTKPGVMVLLLFTTLAAMLVAVGGLPSARILFWTLVGGALASGGASAINHYLDRDIDRLMTRTRNRPLPGGRLAPVQVAIFGGVLTVLSMMALIAFVNPLAAALSLAGNLFYVFVYTRWLKRATPQNIVIGGAAGSVPPVVGWAAVQGSVGLPALLMFGLIFLWTPPHFWALALFKRGDYAAAGVPMLPAVKGDDATRRQIVGYSVAMIATSLLFVPLGGAGPLYLLAALLFGTVFARSVATLWRTHSDAAARRLFVHSIYYLGLIFLALVVDRVARL
jgi:protoheme IX farnesyltransferase